MFKDVIFDVDIEHRIATKIIIDTCDGYEAARGWASYLENQLTLPFQAKCIKKINTSPLDLDEIVTVLEIDTQFCEHDMLVTIDWNNRVLAVPLCQLEGVDIDNRTLQNISDWHYWINSGRSF